MPGDVDLAAIGAVLAEPARARMLLALGDGRALPAGTLAGEAGVAASTASEHLARLVDGGLVTVHPQGRHRYYRLAGPEVGQLIEKLARLAPAAPARAPREDSRAYAVRRARTCYDHLAGRLGVAVFAALLHQGFVTGGDGIHRIDGDGEDRLSAPGRDIDYRLTASGHTRLSELGVDLPRMDDRGIPLRYCVDWTEQRHHLSGRVGRALTDRLLALGWLKRADRGRAVLITDDGRERLPADLGVALPAT